MGERTDGRFLEGSILRLDERIEASGSFWLPEEPDRKFSGVLCISDSGNATLEVREETRQITFPIEEGIRIVGRMDQLGYVTLEECISRSFSSGLSSTWSFYVRYVLVGVGFEDGETPHFEQVQFSVEGLSDWLGISGFNIPLEEYSSNQGQITISFRIPNSIEVPLSEDLDMEFCFGVTFPSIRRVITEATMSQNAYIRLKSRNHLHIDDIVELSLKIRNFLCFAIGQTVSIRTFTVHTDTIRREYDDSQMVPIRVYFQSPQHPDEAPEIREHRMLFRYPEIKDDIGSMLVKWLDGYEIYNPTLSLYFTARFDFVMYLVVRFTNLTQALEAMHRRTSDKTVMQVEEFTSIQDSLLTQCPANQKVWLKTRLQYANELSLRQRLKRLVAPFREWFGNSESREAFVGKVVDTRNYLTHYDQGLACRAAGGQDLYDLCEKLDALIQLNLLKAIGFSDDAIRLVVNGPYSPLKRKLRT